MNKFQKRCVEIVGKIDAKYDVTRDNHLGFVQLMEEVGELAKEINKPKLRNLEIDRENLEGEFADVALQLFMLAEILDVDIEDAVESKIKILKKRHGI